MKQILTICMMLISLASYSQDTLCVMITLDEIINFNYTTSEIIGRQKHKDDYQIKVNKDQILCLHLCDEKKRYRDVIVEFENEPCMRNTFNSYDYVLYTVEGWGNMLVSISEPRRKK